ncbi:MAG: 3-phosphoshikimate 1-carboxyvinyltransferase [Candidatus Omnitrophica bacterium]|nr:3-phosphoshikimate 1-carboxyvinyltransferase [Candidatus Omnitrophota bacterium]
MTHVKIQTVDQKIRGTVSFPGDKSLSHRAIIFGALSEGTSSFTNVLPAEDCRHTREAFESMGVEIRSKGATALEIVGKGLYGLKAPKKEIYLGNSGTSMRLLLGILAGQSFEATLTGDPSLSQRPMRRVTAYLKEMGAALEGREEANFAPLKIHGGRLKAIRAVLPVSSAQVKSALLLAGLFAQGETSVTEPVRSRDHTERFLKHFGVAVREDGLSVAVSGDQTPRSRNFEIAGDISSAAFFMGIAALLPDADIQFRSVLWNPTRTGVVEVLKRMGVKFRVTSVSESGPEPVADFTVQRGPLKAFEITKEELPSLIDEIPILAALATQARGTSVIRDAGELRVKETDRIHSMVSQLSRLGAKIKETGDSMIIEGPTPLSGASVNSFKDHRTAMSLVVAGMIARGETLVEDVECINTSFPGFFWLLDQLYIKHELVQ